jgi:hypothetical protein
MANQVQFKNIPTDRIAIKNGPSKYDLMLALFDRKGANTRRVTFEVDTQKASVEVVITGIEAEDGSGESWNFKGFASSVWQNHMSVPRRVEGYYSTQSRQGSFRYLD